MLTLEQQQTRAELIGASDVAVIVMGQSYPWQKSTNQMSLWLEKTGRVDPSPGNTTTRAGDRMEPSLVAYAEEVLGPLVRKGRVVEHNLQVIHPNGVMIATLDARLKDRPYLVETKSVGQTSPFYPKHRWGPPESEVTDVAMTSRVIGFGPGGSPIFGDGIVPEEYWWQCVAQVACVNANLRGKRGTAIQGVYLVAHLPGTPEPFRHYLLTPGEAHVAMVEDAVCDWYERYISEDLAPPEPIPLETLQTMNLAEGWGEASDAHFSHIRDLKQRMSLANEQLRELERDLEKAQGDLWAEAGPFNRVRCPAGHYVERRQVQVAPKLHVRTTFKWEWNDGQQH